MSPNSSIIGTKQFDLTLPDRTPLREHVATALVRYWPTNARLVESLPIPATSAGPSTRLTLVPVPLPDWARSNGSVRVIFVPAEAVVGRPSVESVDWWTAAFLLLECWHERIVERRGGPIHSYSARLDGWDTRAWDRAWVNRIALLLRDWAAQEASADPETLFGPIPPARIRVTHDVDAVEKTVAIQLKQTAFNAFNLAKGVLRRDGAGIRGAGGAIARFLRPGGEWDFLEVVDREEAARGIRGQFNFHVDGGQRKSWLMDPGYRMTHRLRDQIRELADRGAEIGIHPGYHSWDSAKELRVQIAALEEVAGTPVRSGRQHWLRFAFERTWTAQAAAGLTEDTTLMFNDRPGFRAAAAIAWSPWDTDAASQHEIVETPTILMDSHFYDYAPGAPGFSTRVDDWIEEVHQVGGECAVLWHPHTLATDYGWREGFSSLLNAVADRRAESEFGEAEG